jgi:hypothetical protein
MAAAKAEIVHVPYECPRCREPGFIRTDLLGKSLVCRNCKYVFHINELMQAVRGKRPAVDPNAVNPHLDQRVTRRKAPKWLRALAPYTRGPYAYAAAGGAAILLVTIGLFAAKSLGGVPLPESLGEREIMLTKAIQTDDARQLRALTESSTAGEAQDFIDAVLKQNKALPKLKVTHKTKFKDLKKGEAGSAATFMSVQGEAVLTLRYFWKLAAPPDDWRLDLTRTAEQRLGR